MTLLVTRPPELKRAWSRRDWLRRQPAPGRLFGACWLGTFGFLAAIYNPTGISLVAALTALTDPLMLAVGALIMLVMLGGVWSAVAKHLKGSVVALVALTVGIGLLLLDKRWQVLSTMTPTAATWLGLVVGSLLLAIALFSLLCENTR